VAEPSCPPGVSGCRPLAARNGQINPQWRAPAEADEKAGALIGPAREKPGGSSCWLCFGSRTPPKALSWEQPEAIGAGVANWRRCGGRAERRCSSVAMRPASSGAALLRAAALSGTTQAVRRRVIGSDGAIWLKPSALSAAVGLENRHEMRSRSILISDQSGGRYLASAEAAATEQVPRMNAPNLRPLNLVSFDLSLAARQTLSFISLPNGPRRQARRRSRPVDQGSPGAVHEVSLALACCSPLTLPRQKAGRPVLRSVPRGGRADVPLPDAQRGR
jgi:hypothetical protein